MKPSRFKLIVSVVVKFGSGFLMMGLLLFPPAGSLSYVNGWIFIAAMAIPMILFGVFLLVKTPETLARRLQSKEPDKTQGANVAFSGLMFAASFILAGLDFRFGWSGVTFAGVGAALLLMFLGYGLYVAVILQNAYAARVVAVYEDQKIITGGLYSLVRHPMYLATLLIFLSMPVILGSWYALLPMLAYPVILIRRIKNEEALLVRELDGYGDYMKNVRFRLLPFIW